MSIWHEAKEVDISDGEFNILFDTDYSGRIYVTVPIDIIRGLLATHDKKLGGNNDNDKAA